MKVVIWIVSDLVLNESIDGASLATQGNIVNLKLFMKFGIYKIYKKKKAQPTLALSNQQCSKRPLFIALYRINVCWSSYSSLYRTYS